MAFWNDIVLPRGIDFIMGMKAFDRERAETLKDVAGTVLEIGFGTGRNLPHYPGTVAQLKAIDPSGASFAIAHKRIAAAPFPVELLALSGEKLPAEDASVDTVVSTFTLCTIPDVESALKEIRRVLKPGGMFVFVEHGLADTPAMIKWQHRLDPLQQKLFGGCHLTRAHDQLVTNAGLSLDALQKFRAKTLVKPVSYFYRGAARKR